MESSRVGIIADISLYIFVLYIIHEFPFRFFPVMELISFAEINGIHVNALNKEG